MTSVLLIEISISASSRDPLTMHECDPDSGHADAAVEESGGVCISERAHHSVAELYPFVSVCVVSFEYEVFIMITNTLCYIVNEWISKTNIHI